MSHLEYPAEKASLVANNDLVFATPSSEPHPPICSKRLLSFSIFPTCEADLADNEFLWHAVQNAAFDVNYGRQVIRRRLEVSHPQLADTPATLFALSIPTPLVDFLASVSLEDMHRAVISLLADAAQAEDNFGLHNMRKFLAPRVWQPLTNMLHIHAYDLSCGMSTSTPSFMLDLAVQRCHARSFWNICIDTALFVPRDHTAYTMLNDDLDKARILDSLHDDWATYAHNHHIWHCSLPIDDNYCNRPRSRTVRIFAMHTMLRLVRDNLQSDTWERVSAVRTCAKNEKSLFSTLPEQIVEQLLVPLVLLDQD